MKKIITRSLISLLVLVVVTPMVTLTAQSEEQIAKFREQRMVYFTEKLELTDKESTAFWPVYDDFNNRKMMLVEDERNTFRFCHKNADNLTDEEFVEKLAKIRKLKDDQHHLEQEYYHEKFPKVLPPRKVMLLYKVEWDFRNHLLRKIRSHSEDGRGKRGDRSSGGSRSSSGGGAGKNSGEAPMKSPDIDQGLSPDMELPPPMVY